MVEELSLSFQIMVIAVAALSVAWVMGIIYALRVGMRVLWKSFFHAPPQNTALRMFGITLCEPPLSMLAGLALVEAAAAQNIAIAFAPLLLVLPLLLILLLLPALGIHGYTAQQYALTTHLLWFGTMRVGVRLAGLLPLLTQQRNLLFLMPVTILVEGVLLWCSSYRGQRYLRGPYARSYAVAQRRSLSQRPGKSAAPARAQAYRIAGPAVPSARILAPEVSILCPVCSGATTLHDESCAGCGLVFRSRVPATLHLLEGYTVLRPLNTGGMSSVYLAHDQAGDRLCVVKTPATVDHPDPLMIQWHTEATHCLRKEAELLSQIDHPNIVRVLDWISDEYGDFLVLEYIAGLTLEQRLTRPGVNGTVIPGAPLPPGEALAYAASVADILCYLGSLPSPVMHLDIKPANLIRPPDRHEPVLVDFGGAVLWRQQEMLLRLYNYGTPGYAAPEQYGLQSSPKSDIYGLGATLYHLLTDDDPSTHPLVFPALASLPPDIVQVLQPMLDRDPAQRPDAYQLRARLSTLAATYALRPSGAPGLTPHRVEASVVNTIG